MKQYLGRWTRQQQLYVVFNILDRFPSDPFGQLLLPNLCLCFTGHSSPPTIALAYGRAADDRAPGVTIKAAATALLPYWPYRQYMERSSSYRTDEVYVLG